MKALKAIILLAISLLLTGCYGKTELDNYAYVIGIGADVGEGNDLKITYQVAIPVKIAGEDSKSGKETYTTYTVSAPSLYIGNSIVDSLSSKEINLSHVKVIVYSEELARTGLFGHINILINSIEIRPKTAVVVCRGKAEEFFENVTPVLEANPARFYELMLSSFNYTSENAGSELISFYSNNKSIDREAFAVIAENIKFDEASGISRELYPSDNLNDSGISGGSSSSNSSETSSGSSTSSGKSSSSSGSSGSSSGGGSSGTSSSSGGNSSGSESSQSEETPENITRFAGLAVFKDDKMVGEINPYLTAGHLMLTNSLTETSLSVNDIEDPTKQATVIIKQTKAPKFDIKIENDIPKIKVTLYFDARIHSTANSTNYLDRKNQDKMSEEIKEKINSILNEYIQKLIEYDSDIAGFGRYARKNYTTWKEFEEMNWDEKFKNSIFDINTNVSLNVSQIILHKLPSQ